MQPCQNVYRNIVCFCSLSTSLFISIAVKFNRYFWLVQISVYDSGKSSFSKLHQQSYSIAMWHVLKIINYFTCTLQIIVRNLTEWKTGNPFIQVLFLMNICMQEIYLTLICLGETLQLLPWYAGYIFNLEYGKYVHFWMRYVFSAHVSQQWLSTRVQLRKQF